MSATVAPLNPLRRMTRCAASTSARSSTSSTTPVAFTRSENSVFSCRRQRRVRPDTNVRVGVESPMIEGRPVRQAATYGAMTMVALCFANGLQGGEIQGVSQATESLRHYFHVGDTALGVLQFFVGMAGAFGAVWIGTL